MHDPKTETKNYLKGDRSAFQSSTDKCFKNKTSMMTNLMRIFSLISFQRLLTINTQHKIKNSFNLFSSSFFGKALVYSAARIESRTCVKWNYWKSQSQKKTKLFLSFSPYTEKKRSVKSFLASTSFCFSLVSLFLDNSENTILHLELLIHVAVFTSPSRLTFLSHTSINFTARSNLSKCFYD